MNRNFSNPGQRRHKEFNKITGTLYVIGTPIGNLGDFTFRALEALKNSAQVACEDTRKSVQLLNHYGVHKPLFSIFGPKEKKELPRVTEILARGESVALLTDAGTPAVSDPGAWLAREVGAQGFRVEALPGPSAVTCAVSVSGIVDKGFIFLGFLPRRDSRIKKILSESAALGEPLIFFESPYRVLNTLELAAEALGPETECWIGRELTKKFEEHLHGTVTAVRQNLAAKEILGEFTVIFKPGEKPKEKGN